MRCPNCAAPPAELCRGEANPIWCRHMNPADGLYDPRYARILVRDDVQHVVPPTAPTALDRAYTAEGTEPARGGCCG